MPELRHIFLLPLITPGCIRAWWNRSIRHGCGTNSPIIKASQICIMAVSAIMVWFMRMYNCVSINGNSVLLYSLLWEMSSVCQSRSTSIGLRWTVTDLCMIRKVWTAYDLWRSFVTGVRMVFVFIIEYGRRIVVKDFFLEKREP